MRKLVVFGVLLYGGLFSFQQLHAQGRASDFFEKVKLEAGWGFRAPVGLAKGVTSSDFVGFNSFYVGSNYALNETWGMRGTYAYHPFEDKNHPELGLHIHKLIGEITLSLGNVLSYDYFYSDTNDFDVIAHAGVGVSLGKSKLRPREDWMKNIQIGLMPTYRLIDRISVQLDLLYVWNSAQDYSFAGVNVGDHVGGYFTATLGLAILLGR